MNRPKLPPEVQELYQHDGEWMKLREVFLFTCTCDSTAYVRCLYGPKKDEWFSYCTTDGCERHGGILVATVKLSEHEIASRKQHAKRLEQMRADVLEEVDHILQVATLVKNPPTQDAVLLDQLVETIRRYVFISRDEAIITALWAMHTWCIEATEFTPYIHLRSAVRREGKSRLLDVMEYFVARPYRVTDPTPAAIADACMIAMIRRESPPTFLWDEIDNVYTRWRGLRELVNSGFQRGQFVGRAGGLRKPTFAPKMMAGLDDLPDTITDRSFRWDMSRAKDDEKPDRLTPTEKRRLAPIAEQMCIQMEAFAERNLQQLTEGVPEDDLPLQGDDRGQDIAEPLLAIANLVGGDWPLKAKKAVTEVRTRMFDQESASDLELLLKDIREVIGDKPRIHSEPLVEALRNLPDRPWRSKGLSQWTLANMLKRFSEYPSGPHIKSSRMRIDKHLRAGYKREQFEDAWSRY